MMVRSQIEFISVSAELNDDAESTPSVANKPLDDDLHGLQVARQVLCTPGVSHVNPDVGSLISLHLYQRLSLIFTSVYDVNIESEYLLIAQEPHVTGQ